MRAEKGSQSHDFDPKNWNPVFLETRHFKGDKECEDGKGDEKGEEVEEDEQGDGILDFLRYFEDLVSTTAAHETAKFCGNVQLDDLKERVGTAGNKFAAWLDDRSRSGEAREYSNRLTAIDLYQLLKSKRFGHLDRPDADRRLIYIANLDVFHILALAKTAFAHEVPPLVETFWKYLGRQTSLTAEIQMGFPIFQLELHLPYYALRESLPRDDCRQYGVSGELLRKRRDLSFLQRQTDDSLSQPKCWMYEAQTSFLLVGSDDRRWVGHCFDDTYFNDDDKNSFYKDEDPIISDSKPNSNLPVLDARIYFLKVFHARSVKVLREWESLVWMVKRNIDTRRTEYSTIPIGDTRKSRKRTRKSKEVFDWTKEAIELLHLLSNSLSGTIKAWETFSSGSGDIRYFSDLYNSLDDPWILNRTRLLLGAISRTFMKLERLQQDLILLKESCESSAQNLHLRVSIELSEAARKNGITARLTLTTLSPFWLAAAYFAMPPAVIPFNLTHQAFVSFAFIIMVVVALLFVITEIVVNLDEWKKRFPVHMKSMWLGELRPRLWRRENRDSWILKRSDSSLSLSSIESLNELERRLWPQESGSRPTPKRGDSPPLYSVKSLDELEESGSRPIPKRSDSSLPSSSIESLNELEESGSRPIPTRSDSSLPSSLLEPLLDPVSHCTKLRDLEEQVVHECRLQKYAHSNAVVNMENRAYTLKTCVEDFQGLLKAIDLLTKDGFCEDYITILVQNPTGRPNVAEAIESDVKKFRELVNGIVTHASRLCARTDHEHAVTLDADTRLWRSEIMSYLDTLLLSRIKDEGEDSGNWGGSEPEQDPLFPTSENFQGYEGASSDETLPFGKVNAIGSFLYWCKCFHSVLALALSSYAGSHVSNFSKFLRQAGYESFLISPNLAFRQQPLACLHGYLGSPAWIFGSPYSVDGEFQVAISINAFADLWGPIWIVPADSPGYIRHICTERGFLQRTSSPEEENGTEIPCHWFAASAGFNGTMVPESQELFRPSTSNTSLKTPHFAVNLAPTIPENSRLLIGTPTESTQKICRSAGVALPATRNSSQTEAPYGMTIYGSCCVDLSKFIDLNSLQLSGVREEAYMDDSYSFSIVGGNYFTLGISKTRKRIPGTKYKDQLLEWLSKPNPKERILPLLKIHAGLEVSICTGNARRVTLWEVLRLASTLRRSLVPSGLANSTGIDCSHHVGDTKCLMHCWNSRSSSSIDTGEWEQRDDYWQTVANALVLLNHTGVDPQGYLRAYWPYSSVPHTYPIKRECSEAKNYWIPMVTDSPVAATFATMTPRCLRYHARDDMAKEIHANGCSGTKRSVVSQDITLIRTALQTRIHLSPQAKRTHPTNDKPENLKRNEKTPNPSTPVECTEFLEGCNLHLQGKGILRIRNDDSPRLAVFSEKMLLSSKPFRRRGEFQSKELMCEDQGGKQRTISVLVI